MSGKLSAAAGLLVLFLHQSCVSAFTPTVALASLGRRSTQCSAMLRGTAVAAAARKNVRSVNQVLRMSLEEEDSSRLFEKVSWPTTFQLQLSPSIFRESREKNMLLSLHLFVDILWLICTLDTNTYLRKRTWLICEGERNGAVILTGRDYPGKSFGGDRKFHSITALSIGRGRIHSFQ